MNKVIFWDFDGTVVFSERVWGNSMVAALEDVLPNCSVGVADIYEKRPKDSYPWDKSQYDYLHLLGERLWWANMEEHFEETYVACGVDKAAANAAAKNVRGHILKPERYREYPYARTALEIAKELGYKNYILSNNYPELPHVMELMGFAKYFDGVLTSGLVGYEKPRMEIFEYAKKKAGNPELSVMVGDNPVADIEGGKAAGMVTIFVHSKRPSNADYKIDSLEEIEAILKSL